MDSEERQSMARALGLYGLILTEFFGLSASGVGLGYWGYTHWGWPIFIAAISGVCGLGFAFYRLMQVLKKGT